MCVLIMHDKKKFSKEAKNLTSVLKHQIIYLKVTSNAVIICDTCSPIYFWLFHVEFFLFPLKSRANFKKVFNFPSLFLGTKKGLEVFSLSLKW